jgi:hypothetical protein
MPPRVFVCVDSLTVLMMKVYRGYGRERTGLFPSSSRKQPQPSIWPYVVAGVKARPLDEGENPSAIRRTPVREERKNRKDRETLAKLSGPSTRPMERRSGWEQRNFPA